jgi:hypothetical protein
MSDEEFVHDVMTSGFDPYSVMEIYPFLLEKLNPPEPARVLEVAEESPGCRNSPPVICSQPALKSAQLT